jgi:LysM repeat protein
MRPIKIADRPRPPQTYATKRGDTLQSIGQKFQISPRSLAQINKMPSHLNDITPLAPGTKLLIPNVDHIDPFNYGGNQTFEQFAREAPPQKPFKGIN